MKHITYVFVVIISLITVAGCNKYTSISPKGVSLITTADDLERLANRQYGEFDVLKQNVLVNEIYPQGINVPTLVAGINKNWNFTLLTYDESVNRADLNLTDNIYTLGYSIINGNANMLINYADKVSGDATRLRALKAEGYIIRAFAHFYLVRLFAKSYVAASAASEGGIPYATEISFETLNEKKTLKEVYDLILADINNAIALNALPEKPINYMRVGKAFAQALKARVLLTMGDYPGAIQAADVALTYNSYLEDHRPLLPPPNGTSLAFANLRKDGSIAPDNIFYAFYTRNWPFSVSPSLEIWTTAFEPGNIIKEYTGVTYYRATNSNGITGIPSINDGYQQNNAGMTTSDLFLIKAESLIRTGKIAEGLALVNEIRLRRIFPYTAATANNDVDAMKILQRTSRIEYLYSGKNYFDLKRWNREGKYPVEIKRTISGKEYTLAPNSPLWVFPFPVNATQFNPTLTQNY